MVCTILDEAIMIARRIFLSGDILIKHYGIVETAESRITLLRFPNLFKDSLVFTNYAIRGVSSSRIMVKAIL